MNYMFGTRSHLTMDALFQATGVNGVRGRTELFEKVVEGLTALISKQREPDTETLRFPPVTNRSHIEKSGYLHSFPNLLGAVCCLHGDEVQIRNTVNGSKAAGMGQRVVADRPRPDAGRLLSALSSGCGARRYSADRAGFRRGGGLLPP